MIPQGTGCTRPAFLVAVAPGKLAMAAFSPPLDPAGNTVKGQAALQSIIRELNLNLFRS